MMRFLATSASPLLTFLRPASTAATIRGTGILLGARAKFRSLERTEDSAGGVSCREDRLTTHVSWCAGVPFCRASMMSNFFWQSFDLDISFVEAPSPRESMEARVVWGMAELFQCISYSTFCILGGILFI